MSNLVSGREWYARKGKDVARQTKFKPPYGVQCPWARLPIVEVSVRMPSLARLECIRVSKSAGRYRDTHTLQSESRLVVYSLPFPYPIQYFVLQAGRILSGEAMIAGRFEFRDLGGVLGANCRTAKHPRADSLPTVRSRPSRPTYSL